MLNIFMLNNFSGKLVFSDKTAKNYSGEPKWTNFFLTLYIQSVMFSNKVMLFSLNMLLQIISPLWFFFLIFLTELH